ncbi:MAG: hypothetical protein ACFFG0_38245 [Candidatus Thorarchaeota archaeon]
MKSFNLETYAYFNQLFDWDISGIFLIVRGVSFRPFKVFSVAAESPDALAGIKEGDKFVAFDGQPIFKIQWGDKNELEVFGGNDQYYIFLLLFGIE